MYLKWLGYTVEWIVWPVPPIPRFATVPVRPKLFLVEDNMYFTLKIHIFCNWAKRNVAKPPQLAHWRSFNVKNTVKSDIKNNVFFWRCYDVISWRQYDVRFWRWINVSIRHFQQTLDHSKMSAIYSIIVRNTKYHIYNQVFKFLQPWPFLQI